MTRENGSIIGVVNNPTTTVASGIWSLSAVALAVEGGIWPPSPIPSVIGQAYEGGFYAGQISTTGDGVATHYLVVAPLSSGEASKAYKNSATASGASSLIDGPGNTAIMVAGGDATTYPAAHFCNDLTIGGYSDWYFPAKNELEVCYYNLKPTTTANSTSYGVNTNAVPSRGSNYTSGTPAQTSAAAFQSGGAEAFSAVRYWGSNEPNSQLGQEIAFSNGNQDNFSFKTGILSVRAVRRVAV
jgi:hypothetical protein